MTLETKDKNTNSKVCTIKILLYSGAIASFIHKDVLHKRHRILKQKKINGLLWQKPYVQLC